MTKTEFLNTLEKLLKGLKKKERSKYLDYYSEMIDDAIEDGCAEEEAIRRIGSPGEAAQEIMENRELSQARPVSTGTKILIAVLLLLGAPLWGSLLLAALLLGAGIALTVFALILTGYTLIWCLPLFSGSISIGCLILSVVSMIGTPFLFSSNAAAAVTQLGLGFLAAGVFLLSALLTQALGSYFIKITIRFTHWIKHLLQRKIKSYRKKEAMV